MNTENKKKKVTKAVKKVKKKIQKSLTKGFERMGEPIAKSKGII